MNIALTVWGNRISPVFDAAQTLLVVKIKNNKIIQKSYESFDSDTIHLPDNLKKMDISVLICGAISKVPANIIASSKIKLIAFVTGNAAQVLNLYLNNNPVPPSYFMPGCRRHGCRHGLKSAAINIEKEVKHMPGKNKTCPHGQGKGQGRRGSGKGQGVCQGQGSSQKKGSGQGRQTGQGLGKINGRCKSLKDA